MEYSIVTLHTLLMQTCFAACVLLLFPVFNVASNYGSFAQVEESLAPSLAPVCVQFHQNSYIIGNT